MGRPPGGSLTLWLDGREMWAVVLCFGLLFALTFVLFSVWALACAFWFGLVGMGLVSGGWSRLWIDVGGGSLWTAWLLFGFLGVILGVWMVASVP